MKRYYRFEIDIILGSIVATILLVLFGLTVPLIDFEVMDYNATLLITMGLLFFYLGFHEVLHGIAYHLTGVPKDKITYGALLEKGILYCLTKTDTSKKSALISVLTPFILIGVLTLIISIIFNMPILWLLSIFNLSGCSSDLLMFIYIIPIKDKNLKYRELDDGYSFVITTTADLTKKKNIGVKLKEVSETEIESMIPKDFKKIRVSKLSYVFSVVLIIIVIAGVISCLI